MAGDTPQTKGDALEDAVHMIETLILDTSPSAKNAVVTIERKKIVIVQGVKHEIDIYITIDQGRGYLSKYIFECKNWQAKVDKDEIIIFSRKIQDVRAQKGYFVAKQFTKYAQAQAERDGIELLGVDDVAEVFSPFLKGFPLLASSIVDSTSTLRCKTLGTKRNGSFSGYYPESFAIYGGEHMLLGKLMESIENDIMMEGAGQLSVEEIEAFDAEPHSYEKSRIVGFRPGELFIEGNECYIIEIHLKWHLRVIRPKIISKFDIKTRGRVITVQSYIPPLGRTLKLSFGSIDEKLFPGFVIVN